MSLLHCNALRCTFKRMHAQILSIVKKKWLMLLRLPVVRWFSDIGYLVFARYRYDISYLLTGQRRCEPCAKQVCDRGEAIKP